MTTPTLFIPPLPTSASSRKINRVLVANRGEIAVRIIRSCSLLGVETVAVYSDLDAEAPHVGLATQAVFIGSSIPKPNEEGFVTPYLKGDQLVRLARETGCDAVHPGYGYLSENADFADRVVQAGLIFIGPKGDSIRTIGDKAASKKFLKEKADGTVPLVPGYSGENQDVKTLVEAGKSIQYPILIKASAGGGGKGMRIVRDESSLAGEIERAASESKRNFGDSRLLLEKYVEDGKHIEVQIFGDQYGNVYSFFERECSVQRRHQKLIEESPSPALTPKKREEMAAAARKIGQLLRYEGAGTVEFIYDCRTQEFFFLEVNTRLQVEHPITEITIAIDLVALQLFVAGGGDLSTLKEVTNVSQKGHALEARLCAEDAFSDFAPRTGTVRLWVDGLPNADGIRRDTGVETGSEVTVFFDPMLAKLIVWGSDRATAVKKLASLLRSQVCIGVTTNQPFLLNCLSNPSFLDGSYTTSLVPQQISSLLQPSHDTFSPEYTTKVGLAASIFLSTVRDHLRATGGPDALSSIPNSWSNNRHDQARKPVEQLAITLPDGKITSIKVEGELPAAGAPSVRRADAFTSLGPSQRFKVWNEPAAQAAGQQGKGAKNALVNNFYAGSKSRDGTESREKGEWETGVPESKVATHEVRVAAVRLAQSCSGARTWFHGYLRFSVGGVEETFFVATGDWEGSTATAETVWVHSRAFGGAVQIERRDLLTSAGELDKRGGAAGELGEGAKYLSAMPCRILELLAEDGDKVKLGDGLLTMESMKTEIRLSAKADGIVRLHVAEGDICKEGMLLCEIIEDEASA